MIEDITVLCHSSIKMNKEKVIYVDPFKIDKNYKDADIIFITHDHYDHYSEEDIDKVKKEDTGCVYYKLVSYNTKPDGTGEVYPLSTVLNKFDKNLTLYAQYELGDASDKPVIDQILNLPNFDLFHNEEYFNKYNKDKIIYPGAEGSYVMTFHNTTPNNITIREMTLREDETICVANGCLNMGYSVRFTPKDAKNYTYYYGDAGEKYNILNRDVQKGVAHKIQFGNGISVAPGEGVEFTLLWRWVDEPKYDKDNAFNTSASKKSYDDLDTQIGSAVSNINDEYKLSVSITYDNEENYCSLK